ncbi:hypothetical protein B0H65DRAFT_508582 [Neurospora tetraspora]|uniref:Uncharacterized protein n=1 Tax=Neurospora tetraspora TaxID=94610 RepID=A0AAE0JE89_9PEZI|nr:hypothetical protein B0H65DRAFT_508582 [Neurospora tetraspora]
MLLFSSRFAWSPQELCSLSRATLAHLCGFDGSLGFCCLWTGAGLVLWPRLSREEPEGLVDSLALTKRSAYGRMRRRRLEADGDALEMLSIVHCGCPRVRGRGHWTDGNADGESTDLEPRSGYRGRVDEGKTWTRVSQHRGRPAASLSQKVRGFSWSSGGALGFPNGSALLHTFLWFRDATKCDEIAADSGLGM